MKIFKCPDCKSVRKVEGILYIRCACGCPMEEVDEKHNPIKKEDEE